MNLLQYVLLVGSGLLGSAVGALYAFQEKLLYFPTLPTREHEATPADYNVSYTDVDIFAEDGVRLHAWLLTPPGGARAAATFLYFHGNAGNISHRLSDARQFVADGFNVLMVSYRGYGRSEGSPSEKGLILDAAAALAYARDRSDVLDPERVFLFGRSIGAAVAIATAASATDAGVAGLVVENTFTSVDDMIDCVLPALCFAKPLNRNKWRSLARIPAVQVPILFISGLRDELCPPAHMRTLRDAATNTPFTRMHLVPNGTHNVCSWSLFLASDT